MFGRLQISSCLGITFCLSSNEAESFVLTWVLKKKLNTFQQFLQRIKMYVYNCMHHQCGNIQIYQTDPGLTDNQNQRTVVVWALIPRPQRCQERHVRQTRHTWTQTVENTEYWATCGLQASSSLRRLAESQKQR